MVTVFPYVQVPEKLLAVVGDREPDTRIYRKSGPEEQSGYWFDVLMDQYGQLISPGGVSMYAPVSRAAVHKRMKEGKLTCFLYLSTHRKRGLFGTEREVRESNMSYIPVSECKAWGKEIMQRALKKGVVTREELEGDKPDWHGDFLEPDSRWEKQQIRNAKRSKP
jgi:hypothetical protein